jgi:hypothetical protein
MKNYRFLFGASALLLLSIFLFGVSGTRSSATRPSTVPASQHDQDLSRAFAKYQVVTISSDSARRQLANDRRLVLALSDQTLVLELTPRDLRAPGYRAVEERADGRHELPPSTLQTFKGHLAGRADSAVRFAIDSNSVEGMILVDGREFWIEPARKYSSTAGPDDLVYYDRADMLAPEKLADELSAAVEQTKQTVAANPSRTAANRVIELATDADLAYVNLFQGSPTIARDEILRIMNFVEAIYERDLNLTFSTTFQHFWTTQDPFTGANNAAYLASFQSYWNNNFTAIARDTTHLFAGRTGGTGQTFLGVMCRVPTGSYGFSTRVTQDPQEYILVAHEIAHTMNATHPTSVDCAQTVMVVPTEFQNSGRFCSFSVGEVNTYLSVNNACLSPEAISRNRFDFDGDRKTDLAIYRPGQGLWYRIFSGNGQLSGVQFGAQGDRPVPEDYDGDGKTDIAVYRPSAGAWYILYSSTGAFTGVAFGVNSDTPVPADYDGDRKADVAVYRPAEGAWYILNSSNGAFRAVGFGIREDNPVPQDFDGDGKADLAVFRGSVGTWYLINSADNSFHGVQFGAPNDKPVPADFDGDGKADIAIYRPSAGGWYLLNSGNGAFTAYTFGGGADRPVASDFDGDGKADVAVFRPDGGTWYELLSASNNAFAAQTVGAAGDIPAPAAYVP